MSLISKGSFVRQVPRGTGLTTRYSINSSTNKINGTRRMRPCSACMPSALAADFKLIKNSAQRVYVCNLLAFIPIQQSVGNVGMPSYYADSVEIPAPVSYGSEDALDAPVALRTTLGSSSAYESSKLVLSSCIEDFINWSYGDCNHLKFSPVSYTSYSSFITINFKQNVCFFFQISLFYVTFFLVFKQILSNVHNDSE